MQRLMADPTTLSNTYLPTMPDDVRFMAQQVLKGRWYTCPNNHSYYVSECGLPTQEFTCPDCGEKIGGQDHQLVSTNVNLGNTKQDYYQNTVLEDMSERNYCLEALRPSMTDEEMRQLHKGTHVSRDMTNQVFYLERIILHAACVIGLASTSVNLNSGTITTDNEWCVKAAQSIFKEASIGTATSEGQDTCRPCTESGASFSSKLEEEMAYHFQHFIRLDMDGVKDTMSLGLDEIILILHRFLIREEHFELNRHSAQEEGMAKGRISSC